MFNPGGYPLGTGANAMSTRLYTDWYALYQTSATPAIQSLPWYSTIGNHDVPTPGGVDLEIAYDRSPLYAPYGANWNLPARYYSLDYYNPSNVRAPQPTQSSHAPLLTRAAFPFAQTAVSVRVINLNTNPCVADYTNKAGVCCSCARAAASSSRRRRSRWLRRSHRRQGRPCMRCPTSCL